MLLQLLRNHCCCCWGGGNTAGIVKPDKTKANANHQLRLSIDRQMQRLHAALAAKKPLLLLLNTRHCYNSKNMHWQTVQVNAKYETWMQRPQLSITVQCTWPLSHKVVFRRTERQTRLLFYQVWQCTWTLSRIVVLWTAESNLDFFGLEPFCCKLLPWYATLPVWEVDMILVMKRPKVEAIYARFSASWSRQSSE